MKDRKMPKKKKASRKTSLRAVRLQQIKFTDSSKTISYPNLPLPPIAPVD
jgi:hypothetical protein